jgi:Tfp pilus assembly protein PilO
MIQKLTYKQLLYLYLLGSVVVFFIIFRIAIKPTLELKKQCAEKQDIVNSISVAPLQIKKISEKLAGLNSQLSSLSTSGTAVREKILEEISTFCQSNNLIVYNYPPSHFFDNNTFIVETNSIVVKGDFKRLLQLVNYIETKGNFSRIVSLNFNAMLNRKTKSKELYLEMIFQNINNNESNDIK